VAERQLEVEQQQYQEALVELQHPPACIRETRTLYRYLGLGQSCNDAWLAWESIWGMESALLGKLVYLQGENQVFLISETEVTQGMWQELMGANPAHFQGCGSSCPVENISFVEAIQFANRLSRWEGFEPAYILENGIILLKEGSGGYRLPTDAEWEYAAKAGRDYPYSGGTSLDKVGWYEGNSGGSTHPVCLKKKNSFGLCDMSGNVAEWVWGEGNNRVRGGSLYNGLVKPVITEVGHVPAGAANHTVGFRLVRSLNSIRG
jgi:formylglycine-generating enzyme required for sulfatase activity